MAPPSRASCSWARSRLIDAAILSDLSAFCAVLDTVGGQDEPVICCCRRQCEFEFCLREQDFSVLDEWRQ